MSILISKPGILTTVQDLGRIGFRSSGVNPNGPMDPAAARLVNTLVGNGDESAFLEMHFPAAEVAFESAVPIAIGGGDFAPEISGREITNWCVHEVSKGDVLRFRTRVSGTRAYLAIAGGVEVEHWLGSSSTNLAAHVGGFHGRRLSAGDRLEIGKISEHAGGNVGTCVGPSFLPSGDRATVRLMPGPEFDSLTALSESILFSETFTIAKDSDRMGFRLNGPKLARLSDREMLSSGTAFGTVELLPDGQVIILMADHQTTGGYPRIANVAYVDLSVLAQLDAGAAVSFRFIDINEGERLRMHFERDLTLLRTGLKLRRPASL